MAAVNADFGSTGRSRAWRAVSSARQRVGTRLRAIPGMRHMLEACAVVTPFGWLVIASAIAGSVGAMAAGWAESFALAIVCVTLLVIAIVLIAAPSPYRVSLRLPQERVSAGQTALAEIRVVNDTARLGKLIVRQYEETHRSHHLIVLDTARSSWDRDSFEDGISVAASLALSGIAASRTVSFAAGKRWVPTTTAVSMLDTLASLSFSGRSDITARVRRAFASCPSASYVSVIAPSSVSDEEAAHLAQVTPRDVTVQVLRINPKQRARRRSLEGGVLFDCPSLQELAHLVGGLR